MSSELVAHLQDLLRGTRWEGCIKAKAMFGGVGLYCDGRFCAIVFDETLYVKTDTGLEPYVYRMKGKSLRLSYYPVPPEALEDGAELARWLERAWQAAGRRKKKAN